MFLFLLLAAVGFGHALVNIATEKPNKNTVHIEGVGVLRRTSSAACPRKPRAWGLKDAPVTVQVFDDVQSSECRAKPSSRRSRR